MSLTPTAIPQSDTYGSLLTTYTRKTDGFLSEPYVYTLAGWFAVCVGLATFTLLWCACVSLCRLGMCDSCCADCCIKVKHCCCGGNPKDKYPRRTRCLVGSFIILLVVLVSALVKFSNHYEVSVSMGGKRVTDALSMTASAISEGANKLSSLNAELRQVHLSPNLEQDFLQTGHVALGISRGIEDVLEYVEQSMVVQHDVSVAALVLVSWSLFCLTFGLCCKQWNCSHCFVASGLLGLVFIWSSVALVMPMGAVSLDGCHYCLDWVNSQQSDKGPNLLEFHGFGIAARLQCPTNTSMPAGLVAMNSSLDIAVGQLNNALAEVGLSPVGQTVTAKPNVTSAEQLRAWKLQLNLVKAEFFDKVQNECPDLKPPCTQQQIETLSAYLIDFDTLLDTGKILVDFGSCLYLANFFNTLLTDFCADYAYSAQTLGFWSLGLGLSLLIILYFGLWSFNIFSVRHFKFDDERPSARTKRRVQPVDMSGTEGVARTPSIGTAAIRSQEGLTGWMKPEIHQNTDTDIVDVTGHEGVPDYNLETDTGSPPAFEGSVGPVPPTLENVGKGLFPPGVSVSLTPHLSPELGGRTMPLSPQPVTFFALETTENSSSQPGLTRYAQQPQSHDFSTGDFII
eukprot:gb/GEZN01003917.1/.p1 GENE.gb/GEZN01003917.1/~~gb/GEZN01003917.1/.p1  ORF type:complete len:624 (+),score=46.32 gb/GEZN01003917.1/:134-2005(+)